MPRQTIQPERLTVEQAARMLNVRKRHIYRLVEQGKLTPIRSVIGQGRGGRRVYYDRAQVEALRAEIIAPTETG